MKVAEVEKGFENNEGKGYLMKKNEKHVIGLYWPKRTKQTKKGKLIVFIC